VIYSYRFLNKNAYTVDLFIFLIVLIVSKFYLPEQFSTVGNYIRVFQEIQNKNELLVKAVSLFARAAARSLTIMIYRGQKSSDSDITPRCSNDAGVDNLTAFCGDQGMVNDYDGEDRQLRQAVGSRVERATRALGNDSSR